METLINLGAVDFLSHLRRDIDPSLYQHIDCVVSNLLSLPETIDNHMEHLHYEKQIINRNIVTQNEVAQLTEVENDKTIHLDNIKKKNPLHNGFSGY